MALVFSYGAVIAAIGGAAGRNESAIAAVVAGKRPEARVSWWGFDPVDSTAALQSAINSGARRLIVENMGKPWITDKLTLVDNLEIVFEKGVVVQAKRGGFKGSGDSLFSATLKTNIALIGPGATLRMWKQDYDDPAQYQHAEWRHVLNFKSCAGVRVEGLTLADSGGDGIYLGVTRAGVPCSEVVIKNVVCANNYRQGISVISARNLLIEDCVFKDTGGTAPEAGIDFEPNAATEELVNCVMRNCVSENNQGRAYTFYLRPLTAASKPVSIRLENCRALGCRNSVSFITANDREDAGVRGKIEFINCRFEGSQQEGVIIGNKPVDGVAMRFVNCELVRPAAKSPASAPILFTSGATGEGMMGNVVFDNFRVLDDLNRQPMAYRDLSGGVGLTNITGTLVVEQGGARLSHRLTPELLVAWMPHRSFKQIAKFDARGLAFEPVFPGAMPALDRPTTARQRGLSEWLLWATAEEAVTFGVIIRPVGKGNPQPVPVTVISPAGAITKMSAARGEGETAYEFKAAEAGAYKVICEPRNWTATVRSPQRPVCLFSQSSAFQLLGTTGRFCFWVPPGTREFAIKASGGGGVERVKLAVMDPAGKTVAGQDNLEAAHQFVMQPGPGGAGEVWSLQLDRPSDGVLEDVTLQLQGVPAVLAESRELLLKPKR